MILKGRRKIMSEFKSSDLANSTVLASVINTSMARHIQNKSEIDYLVAYRNGTQPILEKN